MNMADIEILRIGDREYLTLQDAARYLGCEVERVQDYVYLEKLRAEKVGSRWLIEWSSVQAFAAKRGQKSRVR
jgi:excisionase family DNA binding protein